MAMIIPTHNSWILDCVINICITSVGVFPGWGTITFILTLENGQVGAQIWLKYVLYIP